MFSVNADSVTDTTANLSFTINPNGADTSYVIQYGDADPGDDQTTDPVDIGADAGDQQLTATLQNLDPNSDYHFEVIATNSVDTTTQSGQDFTTDTQIGGIARLPIELDDTGQSNFGCPRSARIDWGDNSGVQHVVPDCLFAGDEEDPAQYELTADHTYASPATTTSRSPTRTSSRPAPSSRRSPRTTRRLRRTTRCRRSRGRRRRGTR